MLTQGDALHLNHKYKEYVEWSEKFCGLLENDFPEFYHEKIDEHQLKKIIEKE